MKNINKFKIIIIISISLVFIFIAFAVVAKNIKATARVEGWVTIGTTTDSLIILTNYSNININGKKYE